MVLRVVNNLLAQEQQLLPLLQPVGRLRQQQLVHRRVLWMQPLINCQKSVQSNREPMDSYVTYVRCCCLDARLVVVERQKQH